MTGEVNAKKAAEVEVAMQDLGRAVESVEKRVEVLTMRIAPVINPEEETEAKLDAKPEKPVLCPLALAITEAAGSINRIDYKLGSLTNRIEL